MTSPLDQTLKGGPEGNSPSIPPIRILACLLLIFILGAGLRFTRITEMEPRIWDEACYLLEARFLSTFCKATWDSGNLFLKEKLTKEDLWKKEEQFSRIQDSIKGQSPKYGRILHDTFLAAGTLLTGGERVYMGNLVNAAFGTLTIIWIFLLGRLMYDDRIGLLAALIFAVMGYHIHYSRSGLAEADTLFFLVPAFYYYYKSRFRYPALSQKDLALCGLSLGIGFTIHSRCLVMLGMIFLLDLLLFWKPGNIQKQTRIMRVFLLSAFFLLPSFLWESLYHLILIGFKRLHLLMTSSTYFEQVLYGFWHSMLWGYVSDTFRLSGFLSFPYLYQHTNGIIISLLLVAGLFFALRRRSLADQILGAWFLFPFVLYSLTSAGLMRFFSLILPPAALLSAAVFYKFPQSKAGASPWKSRFYTFVKPAVFVLVLVSGVYFSWTRVVPSQSGYAAAMSFLKNATDTPQFIATGPPHCQVYVGIDQVVRPPATMEELEELYRAGFRYYVIDYNRIMYVPYMPERVEVMEHATEALTPVASFPNDFVGSPQTAFEANLNFWMTIEGLKMVQQEKLDQILIYDLKDFFEP